MNSISLTNCLSMSLPLCAPGCLPIFCESLQEIIGTDYQNFPNSELGTTDWTKKEDPLMHRIERKI